MVNVLGYLNTSERLKKVSSLYGTPVYAGCMGKHEGMFRKVKYHFEKGWTEFSL